MNNLIPPEFQKKLYFIYLGRLSVVVAVVCIFVAVIFCVALIPSYVLTHQRLAVTEASLAELQKSESLKADIELRKILSESRAIVDLAAAATPKVSYTTQIEQLIRMRVQGITITSFDFKDIGTEKQGVVIMGVASNRDVLVQFAKRFADGAEYGFGPVTIPVENFQKKSAIPFTLTIPLIKPQS